MKKVLIILGILIALSVIAFGLQEFANAVTIGSEPPAQFINNMKNCTKSSFKTKEYSTVTEYNIKGLLPNGRCEFSITMTQDFSDKKDYDTAMSILSGFKDMAKSMAKESGQKINDKDLKMPTQKEFIEMMKDEKDVTVCKLSQKERNDLYNAYQLHDGKNPPAEVTKDKISFSFDTAKMSSYQNLMMTYAFGPCFDANPKKKKDNTTEKRYSCQYRDTTCYYTRYMENGKPNGASSMQCTVNKGDSFKFMDIVKGHVEAGYCEEI